MCDESEENDSYGCATEKRSNKETEEHCKMIKQIETRKYCPLTNAMVKYMEQTKTHRIFSNAKNYSYSQSCH